MAARNITYVRPAEPAFLRRFKERIGHQEGPTVETKRQVQVEKDEDREDREDEKPQVLIVATDGRILFRKPAKRASGTEGGAGIKANTVSKRQRLATELKPKKCEEQAKSIEKRNVSLLSFGDEEEEES
uniref:Zgc:77056 n=1 Tax=Eptatretus burgeri TaxID=7764 RepID=A0A8C4QJE8_EPTBU